MWNQFWLPILKSFCSLSVDARVDVRNYAMTYLQRCLLSSVLDNMLSPVGWYQCFEQVLILVSIHIDVFITGDIPIDEGSVETSN